jgi:signal transduction histidine kinase
MSLGLLGMAERARQVGGVAFIGPAPEQGTIVLVKVPKKQANPNEVSP